MKTIHDRASAAVMEMAETLYNDPTISLLDSEIQAIQKIIERNFSDLEQQPIGHVSEMAGYYLKLMEDGTP